MSDIKARLEQIRESLRAESISYGELHELQSLVQYIDPDDTELLQAAGVPEDPDDICPNNPDGHEPDWSSTSIEHDGDGVYLDVNCKHCGRSGCVGNAETLAKDINW